MPRQVFTAVNLRYKGQPTISFSVDGVTGLNNQQFPNHQKLLQRRVALPPGMIGYTPQIVSSFQDALTYDFESAPEIAFSNHLLYHFWEVTFSGTVELEIYIDEVLKNPNNGAATSITLTARDSRKQDTRRVYFPPLSYGWLPHIKHVVNPAQDGQVFSAKPKALPPKFYKGERDHTEIQVTQQGSTLVEVYLDGIKMDEYSFSADRYNADLFKTEKEYLPSGARGQVLQWIQASGDGEVASFESDITLTDIEQPQQEV